LGEKKRLSHNDVTDAFSSIPDSSIPDEGLPYYLPVQLVHVESRFEAYRALRYRPVMVALPRPKPVAGSYLRRPLSPPASSHSIFLAFFRPPAGRARHYGGRVQPKPEPAFSESRVIQESFGKNPQKLVDVEQLAVLKGIGMRATRLSARYLVHAGHSARRYLFETFSQIKCLVVSLN
jgi:hypothetical protein